MQWIEHMGAVLSGYVPDLPKAAVGRSEMLRPIFIQKIQQKGLKIC